MSGNKSALTKRLAEKIYPDVENILFKKREKEEDEENSFFFVTAKNSRGYDIFMKKKRKMWAYI